jgi:hypothetical protein
VKHLGQSKRSTKQQLHVKIIGMYQMASLKQVMPKKPLG